MKLNSEVSIVKIGDIVNFEVGEVITSENVILLDEPVEIQCKLNERLRYLELDENKSYPGLNEYEENIVPKYRDMVKIGENPDNLKVILAPMYVINIKDGNLEFIFNSKERLTYSDYYRDLRNTVENWVVGYINSSEFIVEVDAEDYIEVVPNFEEDHIYYILMKIKENMDLDFRSLPFTEYDIAKDIQKKRFKLEEITQELLINYEFE